MRVSLRTEECAERTWERGTGAPLVPVQRHAAAPLVPVQLKIV